MGAAVWSSIEINVGIICACLPTLKALVNRCLHGPALIGQPNAVVLGPQRFTVHSAVVDRDGTLLRGEDEIYEMHCKEDWSDGPKCAH